MRVACARHVHGMCTACVHGMCAACGMCTIDGRPTHLLPMLCRGAVVVCDALRPQDMAVVALGVMLAEQRGALRHGLLYRSAGALVAARAAIPPRPLLTAAELRWEGPEGRAAAAPGQAAQAGLVVVGSYVGKSSEQLEKMQSLCPWMDPVELQVGEASSRARAEITSRLEPDLSPSQSQSSSPSPSTGG